MKRKFIFVAVVYNDFNDTTELCESLFKSQDITNSIECVIIDNSDIQVFRDRIDTLSHDYSFVKIFRPSHNLGYFGAFNYYFDNTPPALSDTVILCNNDLVFPGNFVETLGTSKYPDDVFVVCPDVVTVDGIHQNPHVLRPRSRLQRLKLDLYFSNYYVACTLRFVQRVFSPILRKNKRDEPSQPGYLHMGIGACYVLLPSFLSRFRQLDFPHFLYGEEAYLTRQVHSVGGKLYYDPELKVQHKESATLSKLPKRTTYEFGRDGYWSYRTFY